MKKTALLSLLGTRLPCVSFFALSLCVSTLGAAEEKYPHIVLVMADDQGWAQTGYMGHPLLKGRTPNLDAMAAAGLRFNRFYAAAPVCSPTRASVLTGRIPERTGVPGLHKRLCPQEKTLSQALKNAGYATGFFGKWHLSGIKGDGVPVLASDPYHPGRYGFDEWLACTNFFEMNPLMGRNGEIQYLEGESSELMVKEGLDFIRKNIDSPTFTVIWYGSPHFPFIASEADKEGFPDNKQGNQLAEIVAMDRSVGMLRQGLRDLGIEKNTLVWYKSDNGGLKTDPESVAPLQDFKGSLHEGGIRVPAIIEWPGRIAPAITDFPASTMDIMPTIVALLDLPEDSQLAVRDGESILPLFSGKTPERSHPIPFAMKGTALIDGNFKLLKPGNGKNVKWALYDLEKDPGEENDISGEHPERFQKMRAHAETMVASVAASVEGKDYPEGKVIHPQRTENWAEMEEYQKLFPTFEALNPKWKSPRRK